MCKYCTERGKREEIIKDEDIIIKIKKEKWGYGIRAELKSTSISTNINYCLMCGRKLEDK